MKLIGLQYTKYVLFQISDSGSFEVIFDKIKIKHKGKYFIYDLICGEHKVEFTSF